MTEIEVGFDQNYLYVNQDRFIPIIQEQNLEHESLEAANTVLIRVPASVYDDLSWDAQYDYAEKAVSAGKWILWELDFGMEQTAIFIQDASLFYSLGVAIDEFTKTLWKPFRNHSLGAAIFRGDLDFAKRFIWTDMHEEHFQEKKGEFPQFFLNEQKQNAYIKSLFAADVFIDYLHRLSSFLPEPLLPFCILDTSSIESPAKLAHLLSKDRFQHLMLILKKSSLPLGHINWEEGRCLGGWMGQSSPYFSTVSEVKIGVCLPLEEKMEENTFSLLDQVFAALDSYHLPFRVITESFLNECWDGLDELIVLGSQVSEQGRRKLCGFEAAGGKVVSLGPSLNLSHETKWRDYLASLKSSEVFL